jgi:hypothetical protein
MKLCKYCNPSDERKKNFNWEHLDLENDLHSKTTAYIVPAIGNDRACLVFNSGHNDELLVDVVLNYCPFCGEKLPE